MSYQGALKNDTSTSGFTSTGSVTRTKIIDETLAGRKRSRLIANQLPCLAMAATMSLAPIFSQSSAHIDFTDFNQHIEAQCQISMPPGVLNADTQSSISSESTLIAQDLAAFIRNHIDLPFSNALAERIEQLHSLCLEEGEDQKPISVHSIGSFIELLQSSALLMAPDLVVSYSGNLCAEWYKSAKEKLSAEFLPNGQAKYVVFSPDPDSKSRTDKATGIVSTKSLFRTLAPFRVLRSIVVT